MPALNRVQLIGYLGRDPESKFTATGKRVTDPEVTVEVTDPKGRVEKKPMLHTQGDGLPDYSELYRFGWSGEYSIRVIIVRPGAKPIETLLKIHHAI